MTEQHDDLGFLLMDGPGGARRVEWAWPSSGWIDCRGFERVRVVQVPPPPQAPGPPDGMHMVRVTGAEIHLALDPGGSGVSGGHVRLISPDTPPGKEVLMTPFLRAAIIKGLADLAARLGQVGG